MAEFMRSSDAFSWSMERDPGLWSTIVTFVLLDRSPDWGQIVERFDLLCRTLPMFRQKVVPSPAPAPPRWEHRFRLRSWLPHAAGERSPARHRRHRAGDGPVRGDGDFDRARPVWEATLFRRGTRARQLNSVRSIVVIR